jgi:glycerol uptake facilitator-like aquaporin
MWAGMVESAVMSRLSGSASTLADYAAAYAEIIAADVEASTHSAGRRLWMSALMIGSLIFSLGIGCAWLIAATWDTSAHLPVMIGLLLLGILTAFVALQLLNRERRLAPPLMALTLAEWAKDRSMVKELLSANYPADT